MSLRGMVIDFYNSIIGAVQVIEVGIESGTRPGIVRKKRGQLDADWTARPISLRTGRPAFRQCVGNAGRGIADRNGNRGKHLKRISHLIAHALIVAEDEKLIFYDRSASGRAKLMQVDGGDRGRRRIKPIAGIDGAIAIEVIR